MILDAKEFIEARIKEIDSDLKFDGFAFDTENIGSLNANNTYKIVAGSLSTTRLDVILESVIPVSVVIYHIGYNDYFMDFAKAYCRAIEIQSQIARQDKLDQTSFLKEFLPNSIVPEAINNDDNIMRFTINFNVRVHYFSQD